MAINTKKYPINPKKIPYYLALILLTAGASIILGFLSFGGMYALLPILPLAFAAFGLSVAYEGEIYLQNLKGAFKKLFKSNYLENHLAKEYLLDMFPEDTSAEACPEFFRDYEKQLNLLNTFGHKQLNKESKKRKNDVEKTLRDMEKWFALHLFSKQKKAKEDTSPYTQELREWLKKHGQDAWQEKLQARQSTFNIVKGFSVLSAAFMTLGSTYLIVEAFSVIPWMAAVPFAFWPAMIVPMALIAGSAYGMLTYNAMTDLINNDTINKWYNKLRHDLSQGLTVRNVFLATMAVLLVGLAVALTICTAGTWWTIATNARPLFEWMSKMPSFIMGVINPIVIGLSAIFFNVQNTAESLEMVDEATRSDTNIFHTTYEAISKGFAHVYETENWLQMINPFRIILKLTVTPLRVLLFLGHLVSIGLTADRMPGIPQILSALIAIISEGFEDAHYFVGHDHGNDHEGHDHCHDHDHDHGNPAHQQTKKLLKAHLGAEAGHNHDVDIPTRLLKTLALPLYALAAGWDCGATKLLQSPKPLTLAQAWDKQQGIKADSDVILPQDAQRPSPKWQIEHTISLIEKYDRKHFKSVVFDPELASKKSRALKEVTNQIREGGSIKDVLAEAGKNPVFNKHRLFAIQKDVRATTEQEAQTSTQEFIDELPNRVSAI